MDVQGGTRQALPPKNLLPTLGGEPHVMVVALLGSSYSRATKFGTHRVGQKIEHRATKIDQNTI